MKVTSLRTETVLIPLASPVGSAIHYFDKIGCVLTFVETEGGVVGEGLVFTLNGTRLAVLKAMIESLAHHLIGRDIDDCEDVWARMWSEVNFFGQQGITIYGISAIDMAVWDARGKEAGKSVARLLGRRRQEIPAYASGGLFLSRTREELIRDAKLFVERGFRAVKLRVGSADPREDIERALLVRDTIGPNVGLMIDANQGLNADKAIRLGRALEDLDLTWFEEPVAASDRVGAAAVAAELDVPIAGGETEYARNGFRDIVEAKAAEILMPDLMRVGGVSEFAKVAHYAELNTLPISPHLFPEQSLQLVGAFSNAITFEYVDWFSPLYADEVVIEKGMAQIPDRPGFGFPFSSSAIERLKFSI
jgi:L-alanine-DL-glutamate epimerase-like enolase superfamily enzyme